MTWEEIRIEDVREWKWGVGGKRDPCMNCCIDRTGMLESR